MSDALITLEAERLFQGSAVLPLVDPSPDAFERLRGAWNMRGEPQGRAEAIEKAVGSLGAEGVLRAVQAYEVAFHPEALSFRAYQTAAEDRLPVAITSTYLPDRIVRMIASAIQQPHALTRGFGRVTERQRTINPNLTTGFDPWRVKAFASELGIDSLVSVTDRAALDNEESVAQLADHRIVHGTPAGGYTEDTSFCFFQTRESSRSWVRWMSHDREIQYPRTKGGYNEAPRDIVRDALRERRTRTLPTAPTRI